MCCPLPSQEDFMKLLRYLSLVFFNVPANLSTCSRWSHRPRGERGPRLHFQERHD